MDIDPQVDEKYRALQARLTGCGRLAIAFSGGVDSALLLKVAHDCLGKEVLALFADSVLQPAVERLGAGATADGIGAALRRVAFNPLALPELVANPPDRCYHCKRAIFRQFRQVACQAGFALLADGTNRDDLSAVRPGRRALAELGVLSPLAEVGLGKTEIRQLSRALGLATWDKPSASCLATRIPTGTPLSAAALALVERAESLLHGLGYVGCRVRLAGHGCQLELARGDIVRLAATGDVDRLRDGLKEMGFEKVFLDLLEREGIVTPA